MNTNNQPNNQPDNSEPKTSEEIRLESIKTIWGCATGLFGISIPLVLFTHSLMPPLFVMAAAAFGTAFVCMSKGGQKQPTNSGVTPAQLQELEERLSNVEIISNLERRLIEKDAAERALENQKASIQAQSVEHQLFDSQPLSSSVPPLSPSTRRSNQDKNINVRA